MPLPFIAGAVVAKIALGAAVAAGVAGAGAGIKGAMDSSEANDIQERAEDILNRAQRKTQEFKEEATDALKGLGATKIEVLSEEISEFVDAIKKIKNIELNESAGIDELRRLSNADSELKEMEQISLDAKNMMVSGITSIGAGTLIGFGTFGGVSALATASTGTAIGTLSGAAATNATLAWLGGGSLAAGGGGMALGTTVLGGIVAGPAILIAGGVYCAKAKEKLNSAKSNLAEARKAQSELELVNVQLQNIESKANLLKSMLVEFSKLLAESTKEVQYIIKYQSSDWRSLNKVAKEEVMKCYNLAKAVKMIIDTPLLDESGAVEEMKIQNTVNTLVGEI